MTILTYQSQHAQYCLVCTHECLLVSQISLAQLGLSILIDKVVLNSIFSPFQMEIYDRGK